MITAPDDTFTAAEAAGQLRKSPRQVQRLLSDGHLQGRRPNGRWSITALAIWRYQGIEAEMTALWLEYCRQVAAARDARQRK